MKRVKAFVLFLLLLFHVIDSHAQSASVSFEKTDSVARYLSPKNAETIEVLANYINSTFKTDLEKSRFIFSWIAMHTRYDINCALGKNTNLQDAMTVFKLHQGICEGYSNLFEALCHACGVTSFKVNGIADRNNFSEHSWNVVKISDEWFLVDATWAAGGVTPDKQFVQHFSDSFFFVDPAAFIRDHLPYDPMWQLLYHPVSVNDFRSNNFENHVTDSAGTFYFNDTINHYLSLDSLDRERDFFRRAYAFYPSDKYIREGRIATLISRANIYFLDGDDAFADYFTAKQQVFNNAKFFMQEKDRVKQLLDTTAVCYEMAKNIYTTIPDFSGAANESVVIQNNKLMEERMIYLKKEQQFIAAYYNASALKRPFILKSYPTVLTLSH